MKVAFKASILDGFHFSLSRPPGWMLQGEKDSGIHPEASFSKKELPIFLEKCKISVQIYLQIDTTNELFFQKNSCFFQKK
jgi:hypothetical protein